jgi:hypothetical protein
VELYRKTDHATLTKWSLAFVRTSAKIKMNNLDLKTKKEIPKQNPTSMKRWAALLPMCITTVKYVLPGYKKKAYLRVGRLAAGTGCIPFVRSERRT